MDLVRLSIDSVDPAADAGIDAAFPEFFYGPCRQFAAVLNYITM
jgi:hypothetical protein